MKFKVWDENDEEQFANDEDADSSERAAINYAQSDTEGWMDGLYHEESHPICVRCVETGKLSTFNVYAELEPTFYAKEVKDDQPAKEGPK